MAGGVRSSRRRHLHRRRFSSCLRGAMGKKLRMPLKCAIGSDGWAHLHLTSKKASSRNRSSSSLASGDSDSVWSHGQAGRKEEREKHKTKGASLDCNARQAALRGKFVSFLLRACFLPSSPHRHAYGLRRFWSHRYSVAELRVEHRRDFRSAMPPDSVARSLRVLVLICLIQSTLSKTICSRRQHTLDNSNFYQRVQVSSNVACIERCIDNIDVCQAVIFVEQHSPTPVKRFCQLYSMNSESRNVKVRPEAQYEPRTTLYEIVENCPAGVAADEGPMLDKIDEKLREIVLNFGGSSRGASDDETRIAVFDDVHTPEFTPSRSRERVSGKSYASTPPQYPFSSGNNDRDRSEERFEVKEPSPFRPVHDPIPIQPVSILHNGQPFDQTGVAQFPCFSPNCRSSQLPLSYPTPCPASHRGDPCAPKPRISYNVETPTEPPRPFWSEWSSAGSCTVSCGHGSRHRRRFCSTGHNSDCEGEDSKAEPCELPACDVWSEWGPWSACPATCGGANQRRTRYCNNGIHCVGEAEEHRGCAEVECPHWGSWAGWRECSASCGFGVSKRVRECLPVGTIGCIGPGEDVQSCESRPCPGHEINNIPFQNGPPGSPGQNAPVPVGVANVNVAENAFTARMTVSAQPKNTFPVTSKPARHGPSGPSGRNAAQPAATTAQRFEPGNANTKAFRATYALEQLKTKPSAISTNAHIGAPGAHGRPVRLPVATANKHELVVVSRMAPAAWVVIVNCDSVNKLSAHTGTSGLNGEVARFHVGADSAKDAVDVSSETLSPAETYRIWTTLTKAKYPAIGKAS
uniref:Apple domain-containing protein n=1 Tax=Panagrellus redivivus TaxID=6233 RepID=A0A7E4VG25_PANRE